MKKTNFGVAMIGITVFFAGMASAVAGGTTPTGPSDYSATFISSVDSRTLLPLLGQSGNEGFHASLKKGAIYEDFTDRRVRVDFQAPDGDPEVMVYQFFDKQVQYTFDPKTKSCHKSDLDVTIQPFFDFLQTAQLVARDTVGDTWRYWLPKGSDIKAIDLVVTKTSAQTPLAMTWWSPQRVQLIFDNFISGLPDASVFNLPATCI